VRIILTPVAPTLFAALIYTILGRIIPFADGVRYLVACSRCTTKISVLGDVFPFLMQMANVGP